jgi:transposase
MDNETITARQIGHTYMINSSTFAKRYKDTLSDFETWEQKGHASEWILLPQNVGKDYGIDETSLQGELYTIVHNKDAHGRKGAIIAVVKGTNPADVLRVLMQLPEGKREMTESITMDLSDCMRAIAREAFPKAIAIRDCFHVVKRGGEGCEEIRLRLKREAIKELNKKKAEFRKYLEGLAAQRKSYRNRMKAKHGKNWKKSKRGKKPKRLNTRFEPPKLENGETLVEALTRCHKQLAMSREKWSATQEKRATILFELYPKLEEAYNLVNSLRAVFRNKKLTKEMAKEKLGEWYEKVAACTLREIKSIRDTIKFYEDEILNYFIKRQTNASAESLNSKIKCFRAQVKGVRDIPFFMYRLATVFGLTAVPPPSPQGLSVAPMVFIVLLLITTILMWLHI